jgi:hypothetical protein
LTKLTKRSGVSTGEYAEHAGISRQALARQIKKGVFGDAVWKEGRTYRVDLAAADKARAANLHPKKESSAKKEVAKLAASSATALTPSDLSLVEAQTLLYEAKAESAKLELEKLRGNLLDAEEVREERNSHGRLLRDNLMNLAGQIAPSLLNKNDPTEISMILEEQIAKALESLALGFLEGTGESYGKAG